MTFLQRLFGLTVPPDARGESTPYTSQAEGLRARMRELEERMDELEHDSRRTLKQLKKLQGIVTGGLRQIVPDVDAENAPESTNGDDLGVGVPLTRKLRMRGF